MNKLLDLYRYAEYAGIDVDWFTMTRSASLSAPLPDGTCCIAMNPWMLSSDADEAVKLAHELGHCETGSFYNQYATCDIRQKHENKADKWAIEHVLTANDLDSAIAEGYTEIWSLADYFGVTEDFMKKAVCFYTYGNLDVEFYF